MSVTQRIQELLVKAQHGGIDPSERAELDRLQQIRQQVQQSPEIARVQAERIWQTFFFHHPEINDDTANRRALFERGLSLSSDDRVQVAHLEEALQLLTAEGAIKPKKVLTPAERKRQETQDRETFLAACKQLHIGNTEANLRLVRDVVGAGFSTYQVQQAVDSGAVVVSPATPEEIEQWRDEAAQACDEWFANPWVDLGQKKAAAKQILTDSRNQAVEEQAGRELESAKARHDRGRFDGTPFLPLPPEIDAVAIKKAGSAALRKWIGLYGDFAITQRLRGLN